MTPESKKIVAAAAVAFVAGIVGTLYFGSETTEPESDPNNPSTQSTHDEALPGNVERKSERAAAVPQAAPPDPRLAALAVSKDNGYIQFITDGNGKIIKEIDTDPNSLGYRKPSREYTYAGDRVIALSAYHYYPDSTQLTQIMISYKPDGSVDQYRESSSVLETDKSQRR